MSEEKKAQGVQEGKDELTCEDVKNLTAKENTSF